MKKVFLFTLLACFSCVMAFATNVAKIGETEYASLPAALSAAQDGDEVLLLADVNYGVVTYDKQVNITKSITLNGQGHTLKGAGQRQSSNSQYATIWVNFGGSDSVSVTIKNLTIINERTSGGAYTNKGIETRGKIKSLTLDNVSIKAKTAPLQIGGNQASVAIITMKDCKLNATTYYPICSYNPYNLTMTNCLIDGWCGLYFKPEYTSDGTYNSCAGSRGSTVVATNCTFNCYNVYTSASNGFGTFVCEDDGISITLNNCATNSLMLGNQQQSVVVLSPWAKSDHRVQPVSLTINGDNSYINGNLLTNAWAGGWQVNSSSKYDQLASIPNPFPLSITISGGTYPFNPEEESWYKDESLEGDELIDPSNIGTITIPAGYEVKAITTQQGEQSTTLYRVRKEIIEVVDINAGNDDTKDAEIKIEPAKDTTIVLTADTTKAKYIEIAGGNTEGDTVKVAVKKDQTLEVSNGMDISGNAQVVVEAGSTVVVKEGGIISESAENIVIEATEDESAAFLLDPEVIVNTTPLATYKFKSKARKLGEGNFIFQRFGIPTFDGTTTMTWEADVLTSLAEFDYAKNAWVEFPISEDKKYIINGTPFQCYNMTNNAAKEADDVEYTFTGNLMGNANAEFKFEKGWNYYANCYTAPVNLKSFVGDLMGKYGNNEAETQISATIYLFDREEGVTSWQPISWAQLKRSGYSGPQDIKPMQAFIMQLTKGDETNDGINYRDNVYAPIVNAPAPTSAPARVEDEFNAVDITVSNGTKSDKMTLFEEPTLSEAFDNGWDAEKFEDNGVFSLYRELDGKKWQDYASNDLGDQFLTFETKEAGTFTMTFSGVDGEVMNLYDVVANKLIEMKEGATYEFTAEAIKDAERFQLNPKNAPSALDNTELAPKATKFMGADGQLYIRRAGNVYTVQGQNVK